MATYCLLALRLVKRSNCYAIHCFKSLGAVCSSVTRILQELKLYLELQLSENSSYTLKRRVNCTMGKIQFKNTRSHTHIHTNMAFIPTHPWRRTSKSKNTENLTSTSLENNITAALTGSKNTENRTSTNLENNITAAIRKTWRVQA